MSRLPLSPDLAVIAAVALLLSACESPRSPVCPGVQVGTLAFRGDLVATGGGGCPFVSDAGLAFTATVSFTGEAEAALCVSRSEAQPMLGTRAGDHLVLAAPTAPANAPTCTCGVDVTETLEGDLLRSDGVVTGFAGELRDVLTVAVGGGNGPASCEPDGGTSDAGPSCGVPCQVRWQMSTR